jgi:hypothetical protein
VGMQVFGLGSNQAKMRHSSLWHDSFEMVLLTSCALMEGSTMLSGLGLVLELRRSHGLWQGLR